MGEERTGPLGESRRFLLGKTDGANGARAMQDIIALSRSWHYNDAYDPANKHRDGDEHR